MSEKNLELMKYREMMYRMLSSIYINEIDADMLRALSGTEFPEFEEPEYGWQRDLKAGFEMVREYLSAFEGKSNEEKEELLEDLAADYAKTFLAAGDASGKAAFPYESVYTGTDSRFGGSVQMQLNALYAAKGFQMKEDMFRIMEDHIGLEFGYMAELLKRQAETEDEHEWEELKYDMEEFFRDHIINWAALFANDIYKYSDREFYKGIARITLGFTAAEKEFLGV